MGRKNLRQQKVAKIMQQACKVSQSKHRAFTTGHHARQNTGRLGLPDGLLPVVHMPIRMIVGLFERTPERQPLGRALKQPDDHPDGHVDYWQQAIWQAQSAGILASMMPRGERPMFGLAYLAGLLHNFGYLLLAQVFPPHFNLVCRSLEVNSVLDSSVTEHYLLGITRDQIAAQLMENWGMPDEVTLALRYQKNRGYKGANSVYARLLWLGRQLLTARGIALGPSEPVGQEIYDELGLNRKQVEDQFDELVASKDNIMAMAGMMNQ